MKRHHISSRIDGKSYVIGRADMIESSLQIQPRISTMSKRDNMKEWEYRIHVPCTVNIHLLRQCENAQTLSYKKSENGLYGFVPQNSILLESLHVDNMLVEYHEIPIEMDSDVLQPKKLCIAKQYPNITYINQHLSCTVFSKECEEMYKWESVIRQCNGREGDMIYIENDKTKEVCILYKTRINGILFASIHSDRVSGHYLEMYSVYDERRKRGDRLGCFIHENTYLQY